MNIKHKMLKKLWAEWLIGVDVAACSFLETTDLEFGHNL